MTLSRRWLPHFLRGARFSTLFFIARRHRLAGERVGDPWPAQRLRHRRVLPSCDRRADLARRRWSAIAAPVQPVFLDGFSAGPCWSSAASPFAPAALDRASRRLEADRALHGPNKRSPPSEPLPTAFSLRLIPGAGGEQQSVRPFKGGRRRLGRAAERALARSRPAVPPGAGSGGSFRSYPSADRLDGSELGSSRSN